MQFSKRPIFVFLVGLLFNFNICFASDYKIKYSLGPRCNGINIVCDSNESPVCLDLNPSVHLVSFSSGDEKYFLPTCENFSIPVCITKDGRVAPDNIIAECIEFAKCEADENNIETAACTAGKSVKCLGSNDEPSGCKCNDGTNAVCDYNWEITSLEALK